MITFKYGDSGAAVEDIQNRLASIGYLEEDKIDGTFGMEVLDAVKRFCAANGLPDTDIVDDRVWNALVSATYSLGDRTLYLRMPYFHGRDVLELQRALGALGFICGIEDGIFGAHTENALRKFQLNLGIPADGIAGAYTYAALHNLEHSWVGKESLASSRPLGFARAADVLEQNPICLFGIDEFTRMVASKMSNLALATNPASKITSAEALKVAPDDDMLLIHISMEDQNDSTPTVLYTDDETFAVRLTGAIGMAHATHPLRVRIVLPSDTWMEAGVERTTQHYAITILDALCASL